MKKDNEIILDGMIGSQLDYFVGELGLDRESIVNEALSRYFDYLEFQVVKRRLAAFGRGEEEVVDASAVWKSLEIE